MSSPPTHERPRSEQVERFHPLFERWAIRVRTRLGLRRVLTGAAIGFAIALLPAFLGWKTRRESVRLASPVVAVIGALVGFAIAKKRAWSDTDVALFLDERLQSEEAITTAVELRNRAELDDEARAVVVTKAARTLAEGDARIAAPRILRPVHLLAPVSIALLIVAARAPLPPEAIPPVVIGTALATPADIKGLEKVEALSKLPARDEDQRRRLDAIAKDAERLREDLKRGLEMREAQDRIAKIREAIAQERLTLGDGEKRGGLESAVRTLEQNGSTKRAAKALGDHDLESMDEELERLANQREKADRELAKKALEDAALAAKKNGAPDVGKALEDARKSMDERQRRADMLRELSEAMEATGEGSEELHAQSEALDREKSDKAAKKLAESMAKALEKLTPEERKKLAEKLKSMAKNGGGQSGNADDLTDMAKDLSTPEGQKELEDRLKDLANGDEQSEESKREQGLDSAEEGLGKGDPGNPGQRGDPGGQAGPQAAGGSQGAVPTPGGSKPGEGSGKGDGTSGSGKGPPGSNGGDTPGGAGSHHDEGTGSHAGQTNAVGGESLKSRARGPLNKDHGMPGSITTFAPGRAGGTANVRGTGDLRNVGPTEVDGVDHSDVPEEYREQVREYFRP